MATNVGKVGIVMKGTWNSASTYEVLDAVTYSGSLYIAKQDVPANTTPTNTTYWQLATDLTAKADKVESATANGLAGLDNNGNLINTGILINEVIRTKTMLSISNSDTVNITNSTSARGYFLIFRSQQNGQQLYGAAIVVGYNGGYNRNSIIILEKSANVNNISISTNDASNRTVNITFSNTFSDINTDLYIVPFTNNGTFTVEKA